MEGCHRITERKRNKIVRRARTRVKTFMWGSSERYNFLNTHFHADFVLFKFLSCFFFKYLENSAICPMRQVQFFSIETLVIYKLLMIIVHYSYCPIHSGTICAQMDNFSPEFPQMISQIFLIKIGP